MSSLNMMPSAPPEQLYPSCRLTTFLRLKPVKFKNKFPAKFKATENSPKHTKKLKPPRIMSPSVGLSLSLSFGLCIALSVTLLGIIVCAPLGTVGAFCGAGTAKNSAWKWQTWTIKSLVLSNRNCINALASKSLIDGVDTDLEFQIVNS